MSDNTDNTGNTNNTGNTDNTGENKPEEPQAKQQPALHKWAGVAAVVAMAVGLTAWMVSPMGPFGEKGTPAPVLGRTATPAPPENTPTPELLMGAVTFTPVPGSVVTGPRVLGITAGVGLRAGEIAGVAPIAVTFSDDMDRSAAQLAFQMLPAASGDFRWESDTLLFTPKNPLTPATHYTVTVGAEAKTRTGEELAGPMSVGFVTAPPPAILRTLPSADASEAPTDTIVTISFNRPMIPLTALDSQPNPGAWVSIQPSAPGRWVWLGTSAVGFRAEGGLRPSTRYTVEAKAGWPDGAGVPLEKGVTFSFTTVKPAIVSLSPLNGASGAPIDASVTVQFNQPMDHLTQASFRMVRRFPDAPISGAFEWSSDSTVMTFTPGSLLDFERRYAMSFAGSVQAVNAPPVELAGGQAANSWTFDTTQTTRVIGHDPSVARTNYPSSNFSFYFNNPLAPGQDAARFLTIDPTPEGYHRQVQVDAGLTRVYTEGVQLLPNTTYRFRLREGLRDKWGYPVQAADWTASIGPLPPSLSIAGGTFQPLPMDGPTRVRVDAANLDKVSLTLSTLSEANVRSLLQNPPNYYDPNYTFPGDQKRAWDVTVTKSKTGQGVAYPIIALKDGEDRLPAGFYLLRASAPTPYEQRPLLSYSILIVGRAGVVAKSEGRDLLVWVADLRTGKPVANYPLRIEQIVANTPPITKRGNTDKDGLLRLTLDTDDSSALTAVWGEKGGEALLSTTAWSSHTPYYYGYGYYDQSNGEPNRAAVYTDRSIYRP